MPERTNLLICLTSSQMPTTKTLWEWLFASVDGENLFGQTFPTFMLVFLIGMAVMAIPLLWPYLRYFITIIHEAGHATMTFLLGGVVAGIKTSNNAGGVTHHYTEKGWKSALVTFVGYPTPAFVGTGMVLGVVNGFVNFTIAVLCVFLGMLLVFYRNGQSFLIGALTFAFFTSLIFIPSYVSVPVLIFIAGTLFWGSLKTTQELFLSEKELFKKLPPAKKSNEVNVDGGTSDAKSLAENIGGNALGWVGVFFLTTILLLAYAVYSAYQNLPLA